MASPKTKNRFAKVAASDLNEAERETLVALALSVMEQRHRPGLALAAPVDVTRYLRLKLGDRNNEVFGCLFLDTRHQLISAEEMLPSMARWKACSRRAATVESSTSEAK